MALKKGDYLPNILFFDKWNSKTKFLIYYEELIKNPKIIFEELYKILKKEKNSVFINYFDEIKKHELACRQFYEIEGGSKSNNDIYFHSKKISNFELEKFDLYIKKNYSEIFKKYLQRYSQ